MRLLVVEDRQVMADSIARSLRREGMAVDVAYDGRAALGLAAVNSYEVVILDRDLPGVHGDEVCRQLTGGQARILMLTASGTVEDRVDGLSLGADDYLPKPFALAELIARIRALGRRATPALAARPDRRRPDPRSQPPRWPNGPAAPWRSPTRSSACSKSSWPPAGEWSAPRSCWSGCGTPTPTRSPTPCASPLANLRRKIGDPPLITTVIGAGYRLVTS